ncbi:MAG TPA: hypothetical protein VF773_17540 [Verrucomicrobiae bacterium]
MDTTRLAPWKKPRRWIPLAVIAFIVLSAVAYRISSGAGVKRQIGELRAKKLPTTPTELDMWYKRVPASSNAALAFLEARGLFVMAGATNNPDEINLEFEVGDPLPEKLAAAVKLHLSRNRETIDQLHEAAKLTETRYPIDLTQGANTLLPHLAELKRLAQLLKWEAIDQSTSGNKAEALRAINTSFAVARSLELEPVLISQFVRIAILAINLVAVERVVSEQSLSDAELADMQRELARAEEKTGRGMQIAMIGERALGTTIFKMDFKTFEAASGGGSLPDDNWWFAWAALYEVRRFAGADDRDLSFFITALNDYERAMGLEFPAALQDAQKVEASIWKEIAGRRLRYLISGMILPSLGKAMNKGAVIVGQIRCARLGIAALRFRQAHGRAPTQNELVPGFIEAYPIDPVDAEPLTMEFSDGEIYVEAPAATRLKNAGATRNKVPVSLTILRTSGAKAAD